MYLNTNHLTEESLNEITAVSILKNLDFMAISEIWMYAEQINNDYTLDNYNCHEVRRSLDNPVNGGGIMVFTKKSLPFAVKQYIFDMLNEDTIFVQTERIWLTYKSGSIMSAVCFTYFPCQT